MSKTSKILAIDGTYYLERAVASTKKKSTDALDLFLSFVCTDAADLKVDSVIVMFDGDTSWRSKVLKGHKSRREALSLGELTLKAQDLCSLAGLPTLLQDGYEVPDLAASVCKFVPGQVLLASKRFDVMQLTRQRVHVWWPSEKRLMRRENIKAQYRIEASQLRDYLTLAGDEILGIPGTVPKDATLKLLHKYGDLKKMQTEEKISDKLKKYRDELKLAEKLATPKPEVVIKKEDTTYKRPDYNKLAKAASASSVQKVKALM
jgi:5'-3' exonuclease